MWVTFISRSSFYSCVTMCSLWETEAGTTTRREIITRLIIRIKWRTIMLFSNRWKLAMRKLKKGRMRPSIMSISDSFMKTQIKCFSFSEIISCSLKYQSQARLFSKSEKTTAFSLALMIPRVWWLVFYGLRTVAQPITRVIRRDKLISELG